MKRFWKDLKEHYRYAIYSAKAELKVRSGELLSELDMVGAGALLFHVDLYVYLWLHL